MSETDQSRLLIVDHDDAARSVLADTGEGFGYDVLPIGRGADFAGAYRSFRPTMVCLNLELPDMDGIELLRWLSEQPSPAPIIMTSHLDGRILTSAMSLARSRRLPVFGTLCKPLNSEGVTRLFESTVRTAGPITPREIERALEAGELRVRYQPKIDLSAAAGLPVCGAEALVRWNHPERGLLTPERFLPAVERGGYMDRLTDHVFTSALGELKSWHRLDDTLTMAINLSATTLRDLDMPDRFESFAREAGVPLDRIILEITETSALGDDPHALDVLTRLRLKGFGLSLDDFGTGYSSLVELYRMPLSELKVDKSFVAHLDSDREARIIVRSIVDLAQNLGLKTCAEGVETPGALDCLRELGCDQAQGFFITVPLASGTLDAFLTRWREKAMSLRLVASNIPEGAAQHIA